MGFIKKLFGGKDDGERREKTNTDPQGVYFYVLCERCGTPVRVRADKHYDLINEAGGYIWHKTIVDNRCFRPMPTVVHLNGSYEMVNHEITGGRYITEQEYEALLAERAAADDSADSPP